MGGHNPDIPTWPAGLRVTHPQNLEEVPAQTNHAAIAQSMQEHTHMPTRPGSVGRIIMTLPPGMDAEQFADRMVAIRTAAGLSRDQIGVISPQDDSRRRLGGLNSDPHLMPNEVALSFPSTDISTVGRFLQGVEQTFNQPVPAQIDLSQLQGKPTIDGLDLSRLQGRQMLSDIDVDNDGLDKGVKNTFRAKSPGGLGM